MKKSITYDKIKITYVLTTSDREISVSTYAFNYSNEDISGCLWGSDELTEQSMSPIVSKCWYKIEESLGYGINDNFYGTLPHIETRFYLNEKNNNLILCDEKQSSIVARVILESCQSRPT